MSLGKRTATQALLPTSNTRPQKRSSPISTKRLTVSTGHTPNADDSQTWTGWFRDATTAALRIISVVGEDKTNDIVNQAAEQVQTSLDAAATTLNGAATKLDDFLPAVLASKPPTPSAPSLPLPSSQRTAVNIETPLQTPKTLPYRQSLIGDAAKGVRANKKYEHIHAKQHKQRAEANLRRNLEAEYELRKAEGYSSDFQTFVDYEDYRARVFALQEQDILSETSFAKLTSLRHQPFLASSSTNGSTFSLSTPSPSHFSNATSPAVSDSSISTIRQTRMGLDLSGIGVPSLRRKSLDGRKRTLTHINTLPFGTELAKAIERARSVIAAPRPPQPDFDAFAQLELRDRERDEEIRKKIRAAKRKRVPSALPPSHVETVIYQLSDPGFTAKAGREMVSARDLGRLQSHQWLNDEIINFWGAMLMQRAERCKAEAKANAKSAAPNGMNGVVVNGKGKGKAEVEEEGVGRLGFPEPLHEIHYFNTFFFAKLERPGYEKARLAKWTRTVDIFSKDMILVPVNQSNTHWTCAAINMKKKRIEFYDSLRCRSEKVFILLRQYLELEHMDKKKKHFDFTGWENFYSEETPNQENAFDCGVFLCMFMEGLSRGEEVEDFVFEQRDMPYLRQRMMWEIGRQRLI
ncbi:Smt3-specific protease [Tulasnella sp. 403]|nr:Smt3-specific protease [Tulasnella sp. 403]